MYTNDQNSRAFLSLFIEYHRISYLKYLTFYNLAIDYFLRPIRLLASPKNEKNRTKALNRLNKNYYSTTKGVVGGIMFYFIFRCHPLSLIWDVFNLNTDDKGCGGQLLSSEENVDSSCWQLSKTEIWLCWRGLSRKDRIFDGSVTQMFVVLL